MSAQILSFASAPRGKPLPRKAASAEAVPTVVILPCVRYERWEDTESDAAEARQAAPAHH